jgi:glycerol kinase
MLPQVHPSSYYYGKTDGKILGKELPICGVVGDQQAALFGHLCVNRGDIKNTYGTGCFLLMNTGDKPVKSNNGLITSIGAGVGDKPPYVLEGSVFIGGAVVQWLRDGMGLIRSAEETQTMAQSVDGTDGVYIVPSFTGLGAPYWDAHARGIIVGLTRGTTAKHLVRAALESIAYQVSDVVFAMERDSGANISQLMVDGGASANDFLLQFQSDILNCIVERPKVYETTALGTAYLAGLCCGYWKDIDELKANQQISGVFNPSIDKDKRDKLLGGWEKAIRQARL